jgi:hypothetical protein
MTRLALVLLLALGLLTQLGCAHRRPVVHRHGVLKVLPHGHKSVHVNGRKYFLHKGVYYQPRKGGYTVVRGPLR